ncbi:MAG: MarR family winged helix-turn-helix transcriptional regulator [Beijerinckiaceae bacterium]
MTEQPSSGIDFGPLGDRSGYWLRRAQIAVFDDFFRTFRAFDIRPAQYSTLTIIERNPGLSQTQVADALGIKKANFVAMIKELEARGLARRQADREDRRSYRLSLTEAGARLVAEMHAASEAHEERVRRTVGEERHRALTGMLRELARMAPPPDLDAQD